MPRSALGLPSYQLSCPLSLPPDCAFCLRVRRHGDVKLQGNATDSFVSNASIVDFFATMIGISIIDILLVDRFFFNVSCTSPVVVRHGRRRDRRLH